VHARTDVFAAGSDDTNCAHVTVSQVTPAGRSRLLRGFDSGFAQFDRRLAPAEIMADLAPDWPYFKTPVQIALVPVYGEICELQWIRQQSEAAA